MEYYTAVKMNESQEHEWIWDYTKVKKKKASLQRLYIVYQL